MTDLFGEVVASPKKKAKAKNQDADPAVSRLVKFWDESYFKRWGKKPIRSEYGRLAKKFKEYLASCDESDIEKTIVYYFAMPHPAPPPNAPNYVMRLGEWSVPGYLRVIDRLYLEDEFQQQYQPNGREADNAASIARAMRRRS